MSDSRTPEQKTADAALTVAVEAALRAYSGAETPMVLTDYIVVTSERTWDEDGDPVTAIGTIHRDGDIPIHICLGLAEYASTRYRKLISED